MAFLVRPDEHGGQSVSLSSDYTERWTGPDTYHKWEQIPVGTRLVVARVFRAKHLPPISQPRPDGLHEVVLLRLKKVRHTQGFGVHKEIIESTVPVFAVVGDSKKRPARLCGEVAFADDPGMVQSLLQFIARNKAEQQLRHLFSDYGFGVSKQRNKEKAKQAAAERRRVLEARAAEAGLTADELEKAIDLWNTIRREHYPVNRCMACGRNLRDPASIVSGIGPECVKYFPAIKAAARARILDVGRMRFDGARLVERFKRAGIDELATVVAEAAALDGKDD
jgi:hypothetical protein